MPGNALSFTVPSVGGSWHGTIANGGATLSGTWNQGRDLPLTFTRDTFVAAKKPSAVDGFWLGALSLPAASLRIQLTIKSDVDGNEAARSTAWIRARTGSAAPMPN